MEVSGVKVRIHGQPTEEDVVIIRPGTLRVGTMLEEIQRWRGENVSFSFTLSGRQVQAADLKQALMDHQETVNNELEISLILLGLPVSPLQPRPDLDDSDETTEDACGCITFAKKEDDTYKLEWSAVNHYLPPELHVVPADGGDGTKGCLRWSAVKRIFWNVALDRTCFHDNHAWVEVNEVLSVGPNDRNATHACFLLLHRQFPRLTYYYRQQKFLALCLVSRLIALFGRKMTLEEMCREYEDFNRRDDRQEPPPPPAALVAIDRPRRRRPSVEDAFHHLVAAQHLFQGIAGPVEAEAIRGPMEQIERVVKRLRAHGETLGVAEDEKEMERVMEELTMAVGHGRFVIAILAAVIEGEPILPGTIVAYSYKTGKVSTRASALTVEDGPLTYQVVVERERVDLLLDPQALGDEKGIPLLLVGTVSGVSVHGGNVFPGCHVQATIDDDQITVQPTALPPNDPMFVGTVERLDEGERRVTLRVDTFMWEALLRDAVDK
jgi:hypothetical protein